MDTSTIRTHEDACKVSLEGIAAMPKDERVRVCSLLFDVDGDAVQKATGRMASTITIIIVMLLLVVDEAEEFLRLMARYLDLVPVGALRRDFWWIVTDNNEKGAMASPRAFRTVETTVSFRADGAEGTRVSYTEEVHCPQRFGGVVQAFVLYLEDRMIREGWVIGRIEEHEYQPPGSSEPIKEAALRVGDSLYIQSRRGYWHTPVGSRGMMQPHGATFLRARDGVKILAAEIQPVTP